MRKTMFNLSIITVLFLAACGQDLTIEMPPENTPVAYQAETEDEPEETPEAEETDPRDLLEAGTAMKWFDDGYIVFVPAGEVSLGDIEYENNQVYSLFVDDFWIYMFKVTNGQYSHCVATGTCTPPAGEEPYPDFEDPNIKDQPVIGVTWEQAQTYCEWMNGRLPSKAEWEKAARGPQAYTYPWGEEDPDCDLLNYGECENPDLSVVYEYPEGRSYYQAFDLAGNTYEWVFDLYEDDFVSQLPGEEPYDPPNGTERSVRGSSYSSAEEMIPSAQLFYLEPEKYRTDLGFRCVLGEAVPKSFANPCIQTAFLPGDSAPWDPAPDPDENELPGLQELKCNPEKDVHWTQYCANQSMQQGGFDMTIMGLNNSDAYLNSWSSNQGVACIDNGNNTVGCFGPEGAAVDLEVCASCTPQIGWISGQFTCDSCYALEDTNPPTCVYTGSPPAPGGTCPCGYIYDQVNDICLKIVMQTDDCPAGYDYDANTDCCVASFAGPSQGPGQLSNAYLVCPPGSGNIELVQQDAQQGQNYATCTYWIHPTTDYESCEVMTFNMGDCPDPECKRPASYTNQASCVAAYCKWVLVSDPTGGPASGKCVMP